jgi:hypothetical protein
MNKKDGSGIDGHLLVHQLLTTTPDKCSKEIKLVSHRRKQANRLLQQASAKLPRSIDRFSFTNDGMFSAVGSFFLLLLSGLGRYSLDQGPMSSTRVRQDDGDMY